ncbi:hypothetical protein ACS5NO_28330 [Larkinella sp. GY13]|uniref:hypothetical protein n=1 Tax=Larkinella sp. GY13 TaxID=3453720 RepID=UPI003EECEACF
MPFLPACTWFGFHPYYDDRIYSLILLHNLLYISACLYWVWVRRYRNVLSKPVYRGLVGLTAGITTIWLAYLYSWLVEPPIIRMLQTATVSYSVLVGFLLHILIRKSTCSPKFPLPNMNAPGYR